MTLKKSVPKTMCSDCKSSGLTRSDCTVLSLLNMPSLINHITSGPIIDLQPGLQHDIRKGNLVTILTRHAPPPPKEPLGSYEVHVNLAYQQNMWPFPQSTACEKSLVELRLLGSRKVGDRGLSESGSLTARPQPGYGHHLM